MDPSRIKTMVVAVIASILILFSVNIMSKLGYFENSAIPRPVVQVASIKTISIDVNGKLFQLNSQEEGRTGEILSALRPVKPSLYPTKDPSINISKVIIVNYNRTTNELIPWAFEGRNLVFSIPGDDNYYIESSGGELYTLLKKAIPTNPSL